LSKSPCVPSKKVKSAPFLLFRILFSARLIVRTDLPRIPLPLQDFRCLSYSSGRTIPPGLALKRGFDFFSSSFYRALILSCQSSFPGFSFVLEKSIFVVGRSPVPFNAFQHSIFTASLPPLDRLAALGFPAVFSTSACPILTPMLTDFYLFSTPVLPPLRISTPLFDEFGQCLIFASSPSGVKGCADAAPILMFSPDYLSLLSFLSESSHSSLVNAFFFVRRERKVSLPPTGLGSRAVFFSLHFVLLWIWELDQIIWKHSRFPGPSCCHGPFRETRFVFFFSEGSSYRTVSSLAFYFPQFWCAGES